MATSLYDLGARTAFAKGQINWETDTFKVMLVDTGTYTFSQTHANLSDIPAGAIVGTAVALTGTVVVNGACDANNATWPGVTGVSAEAVVIYKDTGSPATSTLIIFIDQATGLPITPNTGDIIVQWNDGVDRIFKL